MRVSVTVGSVVPVSTMGISNFSDGAQQDMTVLAIDAPRHAPAVFIKEHLDEFGGGSSPEG